MRYVKRLMQIDLLFPVFEERQILIVLYPPHILRLLFRIRHMADQEIDQ